MENMVDPIGVSSMFEAVFFIGYFFLYFLEELLDDSHVAKLAHGLMDKEKKVFNLSIKFWILIINFFV